MDTIWDERYREAYRKTADYLLVASHVCKDIYADDRCTMSMSIWDENCDQRGEQFLQEFEQEIEQATNGVVAKVKEARQNRANSAEL